MTTEKQLAANRANALKSTGPRTQTGKEMSRQNALRHGLTARALLMPGENAADYEAFEKILLEQLNPVGALEVSYANEIVSLIWRIKRVPMFEAVLMGKSNEGSHYQKKMEDYVVEKRRNPQTGLVEAGDYPIEEDPYCQKLEALSLGSALSYILQYDGLGKIVRYETSLDNRLERAVKKFKELQSERLTASTVDATPGATVDAVPNVKSEDA